MSSKYLMSSLRERFSCCRTLASTPRSTAGWPWCTEWGRRARLWRPRLKICSPWTTSNTSSSGGMASTPFEYPCRMALGRKRPWMYASTSSLRGCMASSASKKAMRSPELSRAARFRFSPGKAWSHLGLMRTCTPGSSARNSASNPLASSAGTPESASTSWAGGKLCAFTDGRSALRSAGTSSRTQGTQRLTAGEGPGAPTAAP
mmetsp:Transcript_40419/g.112257  ORF Transcript_40419/g.112257 Transcript_40419/m.112257 type:complete len:204 (+) Transcript_40419:216-827(+)